LIGKNKLIYYTIIIRMTNQPGVSPIGRLENVPVDIDGGRTFADFEVIETIDDSYPYPPLLGIDWDFNNLTVLDLKKRRLAFEGDGLMVIAPIDPDKSHR
jgi:hypothetical protein